MTMLEGRRPFSLGNPFENPLARTLMSAALPAVERLLALPALNAAYEEMSRPALDGAEPARGFADRALAALGVRYTLPGGGLETIPREGPLIVVANHPFGGLDGLILTALLRRVRPDAKLLGNRLLQRIPDLEDSLFFVDPFGRPDSPARSLAGLRGALEWVRGGGCLGIFPAGEVSHLHLARGAVSDRDWSESIGRIALATGAPVLPVYFEGSNSALFHAAGLAHPMLRTALLPRELLRKRDAVVPVHVGNLIPPARVRRLSSPRDVAAYLQVRTLLLRTRSAGRAAGPARSAHAAAPIAPAIPAEPLALEFEALPAERRLLDAGRFTVYCAPPDEIPRALLELGRLREVAFREVGEGTGRERDLDEFDRYYLHLVLWDREARVIAGAYRMGPTDAILPQHGPDGLYTSTLFRYSPKVLQQMGPAIELGRSFVHPSYQGAYQPLLLLWKGIGRFLSMNPRYRRLFGPVSISNDYQSMSKQLLIAFLQMNRYLPDLARLVRPLHPPSYGPIRDWDRKLTGTVARNLEDLDDLIAEIEADRKSIPVLLRQYLKLNAHLLGFNVDPDFGDVLDGLLLVDLPGVDRKILWKFLGRDEAEAYLAWDGS
jgi:putative hemolysin